MREDHLGSETGKQRLAAAHSEPEEWSALMTLLGGVVHDFNNLMQVIVALVTMMEHKLGRQHPAWPSLRLIVQCSMRATALAQKLRAFTSPEGASCGPLDLNTLLRDVSRLLKAALPPTARLEVDVTDDPVWVIADANQLLRTILELCKGGLRVLPSGSVLKLSLEPGEASATSCLHLSLQRFEEASANARSRAARVLEAHGGKLEVRPGAGGAVEFGITLPTVPGADLAASLSRQVTGLEMPEIQAAVRELLNEMLSELGDVVLHVSETTESQIPNEES